VPTWPQCGQVRFAIVPHRIGSDFSTGGFAAASTVDHKVPSSSLIGFHHGAGFSAAPHATQYVTHIGNPAPKEVMEIRNLDGRLHVARNGRIEGGFGNPTHRKLGCSLTVRTQ